MKKRHPCIECSEPTTGKWCKPCGYKNRTRPTGLKYELKKENPTSFKKGIIPWNKDKTGLQVGWNKGTIGIMKKNSGSFKKGQLPWNKNKKHLSDEKHPLWVGDEVGYSAIHSWVIRKKGKAIECEQCDNKSAKAYHWHNIDSKYTRDLLQWIQLCSKCHANIHKNWEKRLWRQTKKFA